MTKKKKKIKKKEQDVTATVFARSLNKRRNITWRQTTFGRLIKIKDRFDSAASKNIDVVL